MDIKEKDLDLNGKEVEVYLPKTCEIIYMAYIAGRKCRNVIRPCRVSLRYCG